MVRLEGAFGRERAVELARSLRPSPAARRRRSGMAYQSPANSSATSPAAIAVVVEL